MIVADETDAFRRNENAISLFGFKTSKMQENIMIRHKITRSIREYLDNLDFIDIETPFI